MYLRCYAKEPHIFSLYIFDFDFNRLFLNWKLKPCSNIHETPLIIQAKLTLTTGGLILPTCA